MEWSREKGDRCIEKRECTGGKVGGRGGDDNNAKNEDEEEREEMEKEGWSEDRR